MTTTLLPNPVNWFEIPVSDMPRAIKFYEQAFGVKLTENKVNDHQFAFFPMERGTPGAAGTLIYAPPITPSHNGTTVYFLVKSIEPVLEQIQTAGGKTLFGRTSIGPYGFIAQFEDSEGNRVALHELPADAG
jgi:uncharacterized protein